MAETSSPRSITTLCSAGQQHLLSRLREMDRSKIYQRLFQENAIALASMLLYDFATVIISWMFMAHAVVQLKLSFGTLSKPNTVCLLVNGQLLDVLKDTGADKSCVELGKA